MPKTIEQSIEVDVPVRDAYDQWTQFEEFPHFMEGVEEVRQVDDTHMHWRVAVAGKEEEYDAEIVEQRPDEVIAWRSTSGTPHNGLVRFRPLGADRSELTLVIDAEPEGMIEKAGAALGVLDGRAKGDLERFRELIESRRAPSGEWRGTVEDGDVKDGGSTAL
jgi:uncharacterized membrane protein